MRKPPVRRAFVHLLLSSIHLLAATGWSAAPTAPAAASAAPLAEPGAATATLPEPRTLATFDERRQAVLEAFAARGSDKFMQAECLFALGRREEGLAVVNKGLDALVPGNKINRWMHGGNTGFIAWPGIDCYIRFGKFLDAATRERYRSIYTGGVFYAKLSTSNHKIMAALTRYLATQEWGPDAFKADPYFTTKDPYIMEQTKPGGPTWGVSFGRGDPTGEKYLRDIIASTVRGGPGEFASRPYGAQNVLPLLTLADCAKDPEMARQARIAYEVCLVQIAPVWLRGHLATFAPRSYPDTESQQPWGFATLPWLYFGGVIPDMATAKAAAAAAVSGYRIPASIVAAATTRDAPHTYRAFINGWALNHYVNRTYALFSRSGKRGGKPWQGQSYPCGVMWEQEPAKGSHLWVTNPSGDEPGQMGSHTHGVRATEQNLLARDTLLFVFQMGDDSKYPYALGYVPGGHLAAINDSAASGRIYLHYGSVLIAVTASRPFDWEPGGGIRAPASKPRDGDSEFRVMATACAVAIETAPPEEFPGQSPAARLAAFRARLLAASSLECTGDGPTATYVNRFGGTLECTYNGPDRIDGVAIDYHAWPVSESPWTSQMTPDDPLELRAGSTSRTYDFTKWETREVSK